MPSDLPISCSLDSTQLLERLAEISAIRRDALIDVDAEPGWAVLRFAASEPTRVRLEEIVAVLCCAAGPAVIGAVAGAAVGGWLGIACAVVLAAGTGLLVHRRRGKARC